MRFDRFGKALAAAGVLATVLGSAYAAPHEDPAAIDAASAAMAGSNAAGAKLCPPDFFRVGTTLCMSNTLGPDSFANALAVCQSLGAGVAGYGAWRYRILFGDGVMPPVGYWLGPITADNTALFVNQAVPSDFDGETNRFEQRNYVCSKG
jgi:hypothetical protein